MNDPIDGRIINTITFDLWHTLISHDENYDGILRKARLEGVLEGLDGVGVRMSFESANTAYLLSEKALMDRWSQDHDVDIREQLDIYLRCMGLEPSDTLADAIEIPYTEAGLKVRPFLVDGAREAVRCMKEQGYHIILVSNTGRTPGRTMRKVMDGFDILDLFDATIFSNEVGYLKPHPKIFETALRKAGTTPGRAIHVGDHAILDIYGAKAAGMKCVLVTKHAKDEGVFHAPDAHVESIDRVPDAVDFIEKRAQG